MFANIAAAILDQLRATFGVHIGEAQYLDFESGQMLWMITAATNAGERCTATHERWPLTQTVALTLLIAHRLTSYVRTSVPAMAG